MSVLLNVDLGELAGESEALYVWAHIANVACGGHAGDDASMKRAIELCRAHGTRLGAHPSYPDREGFGRRPLDMSPAALFASVAAQCARLAALARKARQPIAYMKPHGALYHAADRDSALAEALVAASLQSLGERITVVGPSSGALASAAARAGLDFAREAFADRGERLDGSLVPRSEPGALIVDPASAADRARQFASRLNVETVCIHGDTPRSAEIAAAVRNALDAAAQPAD